jgi:biotin carboxylase
MSGRTVAVVDPVSSAGPFGTEARALGLSPVALLTREFTEPYVVQTFQPEHFAAVYQHRAMGDTVDFLKRHKVEAVIPGAQTALDVVDTLADALSLIGNPVHSSMARANKRMMKEHWTERGLPCAAWCESDDLTTVLGWAQQQGYPVVLKPPNSSGSSHVYVCTHEHEATRAFDAITQQPDMFGQRFPTVLAEEYLDGPEYFMNLLHNGSGYGEIVSIARYEKLQCDGHASIYRNFRSLALDDPVALEVLPYIQAANTALDVRYGLNDTEFKMTTRGPRVIEVNNRLPGAGTPSMIERCSGLNCFAADLRIFLGEYVPPRTGYQFARHYCACCLINDRPGHVTGYAGLDEVSRLPSFDSMRLIAGIGHDWPATRDLATAWGLVWLVHGDPAQLDRDAEAVHASMQLRID